MVSFYGSGHWEAFDLIDSLCYLAHQAEEELYASRRAEDLVYFDRERREMILQGKDK